MNWYKYWYFTIYFIYDSFSKNAGDNRIYSIGMFTLIIYMLFGVLSCFVNKIFDIGVLRYISHPIFHVIFILIMYVINTYLFENEKKARNERIVYKEISKRVKNIFFISLTIGIIFMFNFCVIYWKKVFVTG